MITESYSRTGNYTITLPQSREYFSIINTGATDLTFTIGTVTITVAVGLGYDDYFAPFTSVVVVAAGSWQAQTGTSSIQGVSDICNLALSHIGDTVTITSLADDTTEAKELSKVYDICRDSVLRSFAWPFATKKIQLTLAAGETDPDYTYVYLMPTDYLDTIRLFQASASNAGLFTFDYKLLSAADNSLRLLCNVQAAYLEYVAKITDPTVYPADFIEALSYKLAAEVAMSLTANISMRAQMLQIYTSFNYSAKKRSANESNVPPATNNRYSGARG